MKNKKEIVSYSDNSNEVIIDKTKIERILIVMEFYHSIVQNREYVNAIYRNIRNS